jgi:hypothetical protein
MATVTKNFKVKHGLVVEGTTGTINNFDILTKNTDDQNYIIGLIGGSATANAEANTVVLRDGNANFAANTITADLVGDVTGQVSDISNFDTDDLTEGTTNEYFTAERAQTALSGMYDPSGSAANALSDAEDYADSASANALSNAQSYADSASANALSDAEDYADSASANALSNAQSYADSASANALSDAEDYADGLATNYDPAGSAANAYADAESYANSLVANAISDLIDSAPAVLDTLNEISEALGDDANFVGTITNLISEKQNGLTTGTDISIVDNIISFTGSYDPSGSAANALSDAEDYADSASANALSNAQSYADEAAANALSDAEDYADSASANALSNAQSYADEAAANALSDAEDYADNLTTTDIEEGTNEYFTDLRAKTSTADLLTNATLINLSITGNATAGLTIEAENGVGDSNTDALVEGSTNLYFTDQRAVDALEAVIPNFTEIDINDVARQVAATVNAPTASTVTAIDWALAEYRSAEFLVKVAYGAHTEISKVLLTLDTSNNIAITEYAIVGTNGSASTISADVNGTDVRLRVATANNNSDVTVVGTLLV